MEAECYLPVAILALVRGVAANLCLRTRVKVPKPDHPYTFSGAKTAATFSQLNVDLLKCALTDPLAALEAAAKRTNIEHRRVFVDLDQYVRERTLRRSIGLAAAHKIEMTD